MKLAKKVYAPLLNFSFRARWPVTGAAFALLALAALVVSPDEDFRRELGRLLRAGGVPVGRTPKERSSCRASSASPMSPTSSSPSTNSRSPAWVGRRPALTCGAPSLLPRRVD